MVLFYIIFRYALDDRGVAVRVPLGANFSLLRDVQTDSGANSESDLMSTEGSIPEGKAAEA
jgi:hypothetical protein